MKTFVYGASASPTALSGPAAPAPEVAALRVPIAGALKVYGWIGMRHECPTLHRQTREIVAAKSKEAAARAAGYKRASQVFNLCQTHNPVELETALSDPGAVFWSPLDVREFRKAEARRMEARRGETAGLDGAAATAGSEGRAQKE